MAEVVGGLSILAATVQLCGSARRFSKTLYRFSKHAGAAAAEVERFKHQVLTFSTTVAIAVDTLDNYYKDNRGSPVVAFVSRNQILANIDKEATIVREHLLSIRDRVRGLDSRSALWASIKWSWNRSFILELGPEMESVKSSIILLIATTDFERGIHDRHTFQRLVRDLMRTMNYVHSQLGQVQQNNSAARYQMLVTQLHEPLLELVSNMYDNGAPPESVRTSPSSAHRGIDALPPFPNSSDRPHTNRNLVAERSASPAIRPASISSQPPGPVRQLQPVLRRQSAPPPQLDPQPSLSQTPTEPRSSTRTIHLPEKDLTNRISGYVTTQRSSQHFTPFLVDTLDRNVISMQQARQFGLDIETLGDGEEGVPFDFGTGRTERSIGRTTLEWTWSAGKDGRAPPLTVECEVCENLEAGLVFGRPFVVETDRRWRRRSRSGAAGNGY